MTTKTKPRPTAARLPGDWEDRQYPRSRDATVLVLPEPQQRFIHPPGPGKRADGLLWFQGPTRQSTAADKATLAQMSTQRLTLDGTELPMRDFRRGDKWLPWHFVKTPEGQA